MGVPFTATRPVQSLMLLEFPKSVGLHLCIHAGTCAGIAVTPKGRFQAQRTSLTKQFY